MYVQLITWVKENEIIGRRYNLFGAVKEFCKTVDDYHSLGNRNFIVEENDVQKELEEIREEVELRTEQYYKYKWNIIDIESNVKLSHLITTLELHSIDRLNKLMTPAQYKEQFG